MCRSYPVAPSEPRTATRGARSKKTIVFQAAPGGPVGRYTLEVCVHKMNTRTHVLNTVFNPQLNTIVSVDGN